MSNCTKCGVKLGIFQKKYHHTDEFGNNLNLCKSCNQILLTKNNQKRLEIIKSTIKKYYDKCKTLERIAISIIYSDKEDFDLVEPKNLTNLENNIKENLLIANENINYDDLDSPMQLIEIYKFQLDFLQDLEKILKLLNKKNITTNYRELIKLFNDLSLEQKNQEIKLLLDQEQKRIKDLLSDKITVHNVLKEFIKKNIDEIDIDIEIAKLLLERFSLDYKAYNLGDLIAELEEEIDLEYFENNLENSNDKTFSDPSNLSGLEFETFLKELFESLGYTVIQTKATGDQGADLILKLDNIKTVVQAKRYSEKVTNKAIQEVSAARKHYKCDKAMVVTTSKFTKSAIELALSNEVELWDNDKLSKTINYINNSLQSKTKKYIELDAVYENIENEYYLKYDDNETPEAHLNNVTLFKELLIRLGEELSKTSNEILENNGYKNKQELLEYSRELVEIFNDIFQNEIDSFLENGGFD